MSFDFLDTFDSLCVEAELMFWWWVEEAWAEDGGCRVNIFNFDPIEFVFVI